MQRRWLNRESPELFRFAKPLANPTQLAHRNHHHLSKHHRRSPSFPVDVLAASASNSAGASGSTSNSSAGKGTPPGWAAQQPGGEQPGSSSGSGSSSGGSSSSSGGSSSSGPWRNRRGGGVGSGRGSGGGGSGGRGGGGRARASGGRGSPGGRSTGSSSSRVPPPELVGVSDSVLRQRHSLLRSASPAAPGNMPPCTAAAAARTTVLPSATAPAAAAAAAPAPGRMPAAAAAAAVPAAALAATAANAAAADELGCVHFASCSGCSLSHGLARPPLARQAERYFADTHGLPRLPVSCGPLHGWRRRARLAVRGPRGNAVLGLFRADSHDAVAIPDCRIHHPAINAAAALIKRCVDELGIPPYREASGSGLLRYVQLTVADVDDDAITSGDSHGRNQAGGGGGGGDGRADGGVGLRMGAAEDLVDVQVVLVWNTESEGASATSSEQLHALASALRSSDTSAQGWRLHSVWSNHNVARSNAILGPTWVLLYGRPRLWQTMGGAEVCLGPGSFCQANFAAMDAALAAISRWVPAGASVGDLHAGVGTIALSLVASAVTSARLPSAVYLSETNPDSRAHFEAAWQQLADAMARSPPPPPPPLPRQPPPLLSATAAARQWRPSASPSAGFGRRQRVAMPRPPPGGAAGAAANTQLQQQQEQAVRLPRAEYEVGTAAALARRLLGQADVLVMDPPRKGLGKELLQILCEGPTSSSPTTSSPPPGCRVHTLIYLSCGYAALERDCNTLTGVAGGMEGAARALTTASAASSSSSAAAIATSASNNSSGSSNGSSGSSNGSSSSSNSGGSSSSRGGSSSGADGGKHTAVAAAVEALAAAAAAAGERHEEEQEGQKEEGGIAVGGTGPWRVVHAQSFVFFPGTDSLETLVVLKRRLGGSGI